TSGRRRLNESERATPRNEAPLERGAAEATWRPEASRESGATMKSMVSPGSGAMFDRIARRYDLLNHILSVGLDRRWRRRPPPPLDPRPDERFLDVATGTADVALAILRRQPDATVVGLDPSHRMLAVGAAKARAAGASGKMTLLPGDAQKLPFPDATFDGAIVAFG